MKRIDSLKPGTKVTLRFNGQYGNGTYEEPATFLGIEGTGDDRTAQFETDTELNATGRYTWSAYRFKGFWAYGSSAERLTLVEILSEPGDDVDAAAQLSPEALLEAAHEAVALNEILFQTTL
jgi:hypothetical protein